LSGHIAITQLLPDWIWDAVGISSDFHSHDTFSLSHGLQVVIEMHMRPYDAAAKTALAAPAPRRPSDMALLFLHMAGIGYAVVGAEDNIWGEKGCCAGMYVLFVDCS
jgi:hypothetical protein